jgi:hypothetical protein
LFEDLSGIITFRTIVSLLERTTLRIPRIVITLLAGLAKPGPKTALSILADNRSVAVSPLSGFWSCYACGHFRVIAPPNLTDYRHGWRQDYAPAQPELVEPGSLGARAAVGNCDR